MEIRSVTKAVRVLDALAETETPQGVTDLARITELDKSSVSRLLRTLVSAGYVRQDPVTKSYELGLALLHLGQKVLKKVNIRSLSQESLRVLSSESGECSHIAILVNNCALYIDQVAPSKGASIDSPVGTLSPLHCSSLGKVLFSFQDKAKKMALLKTITFEPFTRRTITDPSTYLLEIQKVIKNKIAYDDEEYSIGVKCMAAPVFRHDGTVVAAIGISAPSPRVTDDKLREWSSLLKIEAEKLSEKMGWVKGVECIVD
ncbi:IclR family transcriptional regulator [Raoultella ornithinolytica]|uniref:IclR family transcriptional regulator n=1 Tax=Raoultella ornithinolytica TaxID=54291 RepID=UPI00115C06AF|nr:IclR family transcriptional regulator [Raoultella ornithinolytica]